MTGVRDPAASPPRRRRRYLGAATIALGILIGLGLAEVWVRIYKPFPRRQMVRGFNCLHSENGAPVWGCENELDRSKRRNRACVEQHPERTRILFFGSSITYGSALPAEE